MKRLSASGWWLVLLAVAAFALSRWSTRVLYQDVPTGADENSYVFQAHTFAEGQLRRPAPPLSDLFRQEMIILEQRVGWLSRYPPGHPAWLAPGAAMDDVGLMIALSAALAVLFLGIAAAQAGVSPVLAGTLLLASPFFIQLYGTQLSHTSGLMTTSALLAGYLAWLRTGRWIYALGAGLAWSLFFLNRTYTALLVAGPFGLHALWTGARDRRWAVWKGVAAFAVASLAGVLAYLRYNRLAVGNAFTATYLYYEPTEGLGFGPRRQQGMAVVHTLERGLAFLQEDVLRLDRWLWGFPGALLVVTGLAWWGRRSGTGLMIAATAAVWLGYVAFWFHGVTDAGGPAYYAETLPFLILLAAAGLHHLFLPCSAPGRRAAALALVTLVAVSSVYRIRAEAESRVAKQSLKGEVTARLRSVPPGSLVLVENMRDPHPGEMLFNPRGLDSDPLLLHSPGADWPVVARVFPERSLFLYDANDPGKLTPLHPPGQLTLSRDMSSFHAKTGRLIKVGEPPVPAREASAEKGDPAGWLAFGQKFYVPAGRYRLAFTGSLRDVPEADPLAGDIRISPGQTLAAEDRAWGTRTGELMTLEFTLTNRVSRIEPRLRYKGAGTVQVTGLILREQPAP